jgi:hypothetical protein
MGIYYSPSKGWVVNNEKTDYKTDNKTDYPTNLQETFERRNENVYRQVLKTKTETYQERKSRTVPKSQYDSCARRDYQGQCQGGWKTTYVTEYYYETKTRTVPYYEQERDYQASNANKQWNREQEAIVAANKPINDRNRTLNALNRKENETNQALNNKNTALNSKYQQATAIAGGTKGGDYLAQRDAISKLGVSGLEDDFKNFY